MKKLQIAVGIIRNENNEIFITRRAADAHMANKLEFPGGKIEMGETPEQAVVRELQEEVGITPQHFSLFEKLEYEFPDRHITLWFWLVESWEGEPWGKEGQPGEWMSLVGLNADDFPPANEPVIGEDKALAAASDIRHDVYGASYQAYKINLRHPHSDMPDAMARLISI